MHSARSEAEALGLTTKGTTPGRHTLTEGLCPASARNGARFEGGGDLSGGGREREARRPGFGAEPQGASRAPAGGRVSPPAKNHPVSPRRCQRSTQPAILNRSTFRKHAKDQLFELGGTQDTDEAALAQADGEVNSPSPSSPRRRHGRRPRPVGRRVDSLVIAYQLSVTGAVRDEFEERQAIADLAGKSGLLLGSHSFCLAKSRSKDRYYFENADVRLCFDQRATGGWVLEVVVRALFLATHSLAASIGLCDAVAGEIGGILGRRLRRVDLCADFTGFPLLKTDIDRIVARARRDAFIGDSKDTDEAWGLYAPRRREHRNRSGLVTGLTVGAGNALMARIYRKDQELLLPGREEKGEVEAQIWQAQGYLPGQAVVRVEFQFRGEVLESLAAREPGDLEQKLDSLWQYVTRRWLRIVDPRTATRLSRARADIRWAAVADIVFHHVDGPGVRLRVRGGARWEHALGTAISRLASKGKLCREVIPNGDLRDLEPERAHTLLRQQVQLLFDASGQDVVERLLGRHGPHNALVVLREKMSAARARFWSVDDETAAINDELCAALEAVG